MSEDQKRLVEAFNAAADYFVRRIMNQVAVEELLPEEDANIERMLELHIPEQVNSNIADEAYRVIPDSLDLHTNDQSLVIQALKRGGVYQDNRYFLEEVITASQDSSRNEMAEKARNNIEFHLLLYASEGRALPKQYLKDELVPRMS